MRAHSLIHDISSRWGIGESPKVPGLFDTVLDHPQGNPMAGRWARYLKNNPAYKLKYEAELGGQNKAKMRADWANGSLRVP